MIADPETFESVYARLEETVQLLERGGLPLEQAVALFEEGMQLAKRCQEMLDAAELRVTTLADDFRTNGLEALAEEPC